MPSMPLESRPLLIPLLSFLFFLDNDLIVFDFELLGTRICAKKVV